MLFTDPLKSLTVVTDATATTTEPSYSASYMDVDVAGRELPGDVVGALNGATAVSVIAAFPSGTKTRQLLEASIYNRDSVSHTITVKKLVSSTGYTVFAATIGAGERIGYDGKEWKVYTVAGEVKASTLGSQSSTAGTKNGSTVTAVETSFGPFHQTVLTCVATPISIADDADVAQYGGVKVYTFPEGLIKTDGAVIDGSITLGATGTIINTWAGGIALGTVTATTGNTLTSTEANIMKEVDVAAATAKVAVVDAVSACTVLTESAASWLDGTATAVPVFLNLVVDDDATHTAGTGTFTGTITITWTKLGDK